MGKIGDVRAVEPIVSAFHDGENSVRKAATEALVKFGKPAIEPIIAALDDSKGYVRWSAAETLDKMGWQPGRDERGATYWIAKQQWKNLIDLGRSSVGPLLTSLMYTDIEVRKAAIGALAQIGDPCIVEPLIATLKDSTRPVRRAAAEALDKLGWQPDRHEKGASYWVAKESWDKCVEIGAPALAQLIGLLQSREWLVRKASAESLVELYKSNRLNHTEKHLILSQRDCISADHNDKTTSSYSDCSHTDHADKGIGVAFLL